MFLASGIKATRMDDIAHRCGISKRTLYEIFADRNELIMLALEEIITRTAVSKSAKDTTSKNAFYAMWNRFSGSHANRKDTTRLSNEVRRYYPHLTQTFAEHIHTSVVASILEILKRGVNEGLVMESLDLQFYSRAMTNYIIGLNIIEENTAITGLKIDENSIPNAVIIFLRGIATDKGREYIDNNLLKTNTEK